MRLPLLLPLLLLCSLPACARDWNVDATKSSLSFKGSYQNGPFDGRFAKFTAAIRYDESDLANARFDVTVRLASVDTQSAERDDTLRTADFFDVAKFPQAHYVTTAFTRGPDGHVIAHGNLTIRDRTRPVDLKVHFAVHNGVAALDVDTVLNRLDFDLGKGSDWVDIAREVGVHGHLLLTPQ